MARIQISDLSHDETLDAQALEQVRGGILIGLLLPAVQKVREAASVMPTDQFSINFSKSMHSTGGGGGAG